MRGFLIAAAVLAAGAPAAASEGKTWPVTAGWTIFEATPTMCVMRAGFDREGNRRLNLSMDAEGNTRLIVERNDWPLTAGRDYVAYTVFDRKGYFNQDALFVDQGGGPGLVMPLTERWLKQFAKADKMRLQVEGEKLEDEFDVSGSGKAVAALKECSEGLGAG